MRSRMASAPVESKSAPAAARPSDILRGLTREELLLVIDEMAVFPSPFSEPGRLAALAWDATEAREQARWAALREAEEAWMVALLDRAVTKMAARARLKAEERRDRAREAYKRLRKEREALFEMLMGRGA